MTLGPSLTTYVLTRRHWSQASLPGLLCLLPVRPLLYVSVMGAGPAPCLVTLAVHFPQIGVENVPSLLSRLRYGHSGTCLPTSQRHCGKQPRGQVGKYRINHHMLYQWFSKCGPGTRSIITIAWVQGRRAGSQPAVTVRPP